MSLEGPIDVLVRKLVFIPPNVNPNEYKNLPNLDYVITQSGNNIYYVIYRPVSVTLSPKPTKYLIFSHGNGCDNATMRKLSENFAERFNINVVVYDYPMYGFSTGILNEASCYTAHEAIVNKIKRLTDETNIYLLGQSIGTGIVIDYLAKNKMATPSILISPYANLTNVALHLANSNAWFIGRVVSYVMSNFAFDNISKAKDIKSEVLIIHGMDDTLIPVQHGMALYQEIPPEYRVNPLWLENTGHNNIFSNWTTSMTKTVRSIFY